MDKTSPELIIKRTEKGLGVYANRSFTKNQEVEVFPIIKIKLSDLKYIKKTILKYYYYDYDKKYICLFLGLGSLYNHSYKPNAKYLFRYNSETVVIKAIKNILKNEEITVNYNYYPDSKIPLEDWFDPKFKDLS